VASINDYDDKFWRAVISDRPAHKYAKQIYYPKDKFTRKKALQSATVLEVRHKQGEINLWSMKVQVIGDQLLLRQLEGKGAMPFSRLYAEMIQAERAELSAGSLRTYESLHNALRDAVGDFYPSSVSAELINGWVNDAKYSTRQLRKTFLMKVFNYASETYTIKHPQIVVHSSKAERNAYSDMDFKTFLVESEVLLLAHHLITRKPGGASILTRLKAHLLLALFYFPRRISDMNHMKPEWIGEKVVEIGDKDYKTKGQRTELIAPTAEALRLLHLMRSHTKAGERVFPVKQRSFYATFRTITKEILPEVADKVSPHRLRDSGIMYLLHEVGMSVPEVMQITGHANLSSLQRYMHRSGKALMEQKKERKMVVDVLQLKKDFFEGVYL